MAWLAVGCAAGAPSLEAGQVLHGVELCYLKVRPSTLTGEWDPGETLDAFPRGWHIIPGGHCDEDQDFVHCEHREVRSLARESEMRPVIVSADKWLLF